MRGCKKLPEEDRLKTLTIRFIFLKVKKMGSFNGGTIRVSPKPDLILAKVEQCIPLNDSFQSQRSSQFELFISDYVSSYK
jgi:hypothetical protein